MYPQNILESTLVATNAAMLSAHPSAKPLSLLELQKYHGIRMAMIADPREGPTSNYWRTPSNARIQATIFQAANYGERFLMSRNRFMMIQKYFRTDSDGNNLTQVGVFLLF
jgi:hypothetical protein